MTGSVKNSEGVSVLETRMMRISSPVVGVAHWISGGLRGSWDGVRNLFTTQANNAALQREVEALRADLALYREAALENARLRRMLGMREDLAPRSIGATVVTSTQSGHTKMIVVDRGTDDGVALDLPVVAWGGAVGRVVAVEAHKSKIQLLSDPNSGAGGIVQRSRAQGTVIGNGDRRLDLLYVPSFADVAIGDRVVTSGLDGIFPRGFGLGQVVARHDSPDGTRVVQLEPEIDYRSLEEVLILLEPIGGDLLLPPGFGDES